MPKRIYVRDDNGYAWYFNGERIIMAEDDSYPINQRGYFCSSLERGIKYLNEAGYITGKKRKSRPASAPAPDSGE